MSELRGRTSEEVAALTSLAMQIYHQLPSDTADSRVVMELVQELLDWHEEKLRALAPPVMKVVR